MIDDDATARDLIADYLRQAGFTVITAAGGREGLKRAKKYHPIAITLDVIMPDIDRWTVLAALRGDGGGASRTRRHCRGGQSCHKQAAVQHRFNLPRPSRYWL